MTSTGNITAMKVSILALGDIHGAAEKRTILKTTNSNTVFTKL
jgi:hypothetical protein